MQRRKKNWKHYLVFYKKKDGKKILISNKRQNETRIFIVLLLEILSEDIKIFLLINFFFEWRDYHIEILHQIPPPNFLLTFSSQILSPNLSPICFPPNSLPKFSPPNYSPKFHPQKIPPKSHPPKILPLQNSPLRKFH